MKILVTGGAGLIGHNVVAKLETQGHEVSCLDIMTNYGIINTEELQYLISERRKKFSVPIQNVDIQNEVSIDNLINRLRPEVIIHLASFPRQKVVNANPQWGSRVMSEGLLNLLESSNKYGVKRFVYASSSMVYGDFENEVKEDAVCNPIGQYGIMKLAGEWLVKDYARKSDMEYTIIRPSAVYGPLDVEDRVVSKFMLTAMRGGTLQVNGEHETLDFTYVDDAANGFVSAATKPAAANKTYNITKSHAVSLLDAANMIVEMVGKGEVNVREKDADFPSRGALNIDAAREDLKFDPVVDVEEGFRQYYEWFSNSLYWSPKTIQQPEV